MDLPWWEEGSSDGDFFTAAFFITHLRKQGNCFSSFPRKFHIERYQFRAVDLTNRVCLMLKQRGDAAGSRTRVKEGGQGSGMLQKQASVSIRGTAWSMLLRVIAGAPVFFHFIASFIGYVADHR